MKEKLRILEIVTTGSSNNGILAYVVSSMEAMGNADSCDLVTICMPDDALKQRIERLGSRIMVLPDRNRKPLQYKADLARIVREGQYDIVHAHGNSCTLWTEMDAAKKGGARVRIPHAHNTSCRMKLLHRILRKRFDKSYTHAAACGEEAGRFLFGGKPFTVLKNGIECDRFCFSAEAREQKRKELAVSDRKVMIHIGNFNHYKNQAFLVNAFKKVYDKDSGWILLLTGSGERMEEVRQQAQMLGLDENAVRFLGRRTDIPSLLSAADLFVLPSLYEGFPISLIEAETSGVPCLVSDTVTKDAVLAENVLQIPLEESAWDSAITGAVSPADRQAASAQIRQAGFDRSDAAKDLLEFYKSALSSTKKLKKLFIVTRNMGGGGCERVISQIANGLAEDTECTIFTEYAHESFYSLDHKVKLVPLTEKTTCSGRDIPAVFGNLRKIVLKEKPDIVLAMPDMVNIWTALFLAGTGVPVVVSERNDPARFPASKAKRVLRKPAYHFVKGFIFQTEQQRGLFSERVKRDSIVLDNPMDSSLFPEPFSGERDKVVVSAARLAPQKNQKMLMDAFAEFHKKHPEWKLCIYGEGTERENLEKTAKMLPEGTVCLPGESRTVLEDILRAGMFVLSSDYEGMPNSLMEAMALGLPCVSTDCPVGGPASLIENGVNGLLTPVRDSRALAEAMSRIADDRLLADSLSKNAVLIRDRMQADTVISKWYAFLKRNI